MWLTVLCADNRGAQNHHRGEGTQNAVHGRHSTNAAAYTIAILPEKWKQYTKLQHQVYQLCMECLGYHHHILRPPPIVC